MAAKRGEKKAVSKKKSAAVAKTLPSVTTREEVLGVKLRLARDAFMYVNTGNCQNQGARPYQ